MVSRKKIAGAVLMGSLTCLAAGGCTWQYRRYLESSFRWKRIESQLANFSPENVSSFKNYSFESRENWEYKLVTVKGRYLAEQKLVFRANSGRMGYYVMQLFEAEGERFFVNRGWVPEELSEEESIKKVPSENFVTGLLKKSERFETRSSDLKQKEKDEFLTIIDLERLANSAGGANKVAYVERMIGDKEVLSEVFPFPSLRNKYSKPYLTPQRHLEYSTFWGCTTLVGLWGVFRFLR